MNQKNAALQGIVSVAALICLVIGFFNLLTPELNELLYHKLFYILIGLSFILQAPTLSNKNFLYPMYIAAALCIIGAFLPKDSQFAAIKTMGLLGGVIMSIFSRPKPVNRS